MYKHIVVFVIFCSVFVVVKLEEDVSKNRVIPDQKQNKTVVSVVEKTTVASVVKPVVTNDDTEKEPAEPEEPDLPVTTMQLTPDAFIRGFYVLMGLGALLLIYFGFSIFRVQKPPSPNTTVHKYGVKAKRGDVEMLPLPLAEEDEDDTLFDVGLHVRAGN